jgi:hypothetical protein
MTNERSDTERLKERFCYTSADGLRIIKKSNMNYSISYDIDLSDGKNNRGRVEVEGTTLDSLLDNLYGYVMDTARDDSPDLADEQVNNIHLWIRKN